MSCEVFKKMTLLVFDEIPNALRHAFKTLWNKKFPAQPWNDSVAQRCKLSRLEGHTSKIPTNESYMNWDCSALFRATIFASTFKNRAGGIMFVTPPSVGFHATVISPTGDEDETFALAIGQLRLIRNMYCHSWGTEEIESNYNDCMVLAEKAFAALNYRTTFFEKKNRLNSILVWLIVFCAFFDLYYRSSTQKQPTPALTPWTYFSNPSDPVFIGRHWLFNQLEDLIKKENSNGVLLVGDPGSGKTAIMRQLVTSPFNSSNFIHKNIIAYHFCKYDKSITRDGGMFVRSLVKQLSENVPGFAKFVQSVFDIQNVLNHCENDPIECATVAVLEPLSVLKKPPGNKKFILVDALDECRENRESYKFVIIKILHGLMARLPKWIKLLASSRNETTITGMMSEIGVETITISATSKNNLNDIRAFAQKVTFPYIYRIQNQSKFIEILLLKADGNVLFIQKLLEDWVTDPNKENLTSFPLDMKYVYARSFRQRFEKNELKHMTKFFEVLLAFNSPPTLDLLKHILTLNDQMDDYDLDELADKLSAFLHFNNGTVSIFHHSFAEWLTNHDGFSIKKSRGHQSIAAYLFEYYNQLQNEPTVEGLYELSLHVLNGGMLEKHVSQLKSLNSSVINQSGECILHFLARNKESTRVLEVFVEQFKSVGIVDGIGLTPAYYATIAGNYHNLALLIQKGADVNYVARVRDYCDINLFFSRDMIDYRYFSLTFIAAFKGYREIVALLIYNGAHFDERDKCGLKPLYAAIKGNHIETANLLLKKTDRTSSDFVASHETVVLNHFEHYDTEGYLPIHHAVQGGSIDAVDWFMNQGVDIWKKTRSGWTVFDLSLSYGQCLPRILDRLLNIATSNPKYRVTSGFDFWCNTTNAPLSPLHIAAVNGLQCLRYIHNNTFIPIPHLPFTSCRSKHGIELLYLVKLYHDVQWAREWENVGLPINVTPTKYPDREVEYHLLYNNFFSTPHINLNLKFEVNALKLLRRPGISDILPHGHVIESQMKRCYNDCWCSASYANRGFWSVFSAVVPMNDTFDSRSNGFINIVQQMAKIRYHCIKMFYKVNTTLWRQVSKAYSCSYKCRCLEIKRLLQKKFTSTPFQFSEVGRFVARRMRWHNSSFDVLYRWPFDFLLRKALKMDKGYDYLKILSPNIMVASP